MNSTKAQMLLLLGSAVVVLCVVASHAFAASATDAGGRGNGYAKSASRSCNSGSGGDVDADSNDPFRVLGVGRDASENDIKRAYRLRSRCFHPDKVGADDQLSKDRFLRVAKAYEILSNPAKRNAGVRIDQDSGGSFETRSSSIDPQAAEQMFRKFMEEFDGFFRKEEYLDWVDQFVCSMFGLDSSSDAKAAQLTRWQRFKKTVLTRALRWIGPRAWSWFRSNVENGNVEFQFGGVGNRGTGARSSRPTQKRREQKHLRRERPKPRRRNNEQQQQQRTRVQGQEEQNAGQRADTKRRNRGGGTFPNARGSGEKEL
uniref:J domain-containing protein n=1 Tax=Erythrolobus madagascarensis TaxID=708628 RepID=A0A7S0T6Q3_9RHOD|mmetsp:Transcript_699/g.1343  ORF Transcript_699/g.1343 Transcript_699/m.1343 type:complete len:315 (+) Transcript_699:397-1341(+)|eukprot:CAMPEP_0185846420 /NCGR_PEP_ID=MMETSP1354-20130828/2066_1 /TAXON_ID=708628 /ORGANISM="Erythrolobus madagascarensis, Strain CCMP3276" /LENGTH=314 /DNA_ID=CAMNT_0028546551 /DNA_START=332 /DNA_END=1276 /DNA_ORIENTATION=+